jgi:hypothetical protein
MMSVDFGQGRRVDFWHGFELSGCVVVDINQMDPLLDRVLLANRKSCFILWRGLRKICNSQFPVETFRAWKLPSNINSVTCPDLARTKSTVGPLTMKKRSCASGKSSVLFLPRT